MNTTISHKEAVFNLGHEFQEVGFCDLWTFYPDGELFATLTPWNSICIGGEKSYAGTETGFMLEFTLYFGLIFLLIIMYRSMKTGTVGWYRLLSVYLIGTMGYPLSNQLGTSAPGFNRFIGFGVLLHNMAEAAILGVVWRGQEDKNTSKGVRILILYFWGMLICITYFDLFPLLCVATFQGSCLDYLLVCTFFTIARHYQEVDNSGKYFWIAFAASVLHICTIQPLFIGMALGWTALTAITIIFLFPTFLMYVWFASSNSTHALSLASQTKDNPVESRESSVGIDKQTIVEMTLAIQTLSHSVSRNFNNTNVATDTTTTTTNNSGSDKKDADGVDTSVIDYGIRSMDTTGDDVMDNEVKNQESKEENKSKDDESCSITNVLQHGLLRSRNLPTPKKTFYMVVGLAFAMAVVNEIFLVLIPCLVDTSFICD